MNLRKISIFFVAIMVIALLAACGDNDNKDNNNEENEAATLQFPELDRSNLKGVVAEYEGGEITGEEFATFLTVQAFLNPNIPINDEEFRKEVIKELVMEKIITPQVEDEKWAKERTDQLWEQVEILYTEEQLKDAYETLQLTEEEIRDTLTGLYKVETYFREQVTDDEVNKLYEDAKIQFTNATFTHILIATEKINEDGEMEEIRTEEEALEKANELYEQLMDDADMNELAKEHTDDPGSEDTGGTYENSPVAQLVPEFRDALLEQELDEIGKPVKTDYGYHIIRVEDVQVTPLEQLKERIISQIVYEKYTNYLRNEVPELTLKF